MDFLKIDRKEQKKLNVSDRLLNYKEFKQEYSSRELMDQAKKDVWIVAHHFVISDVPWAIKYQSGTT